jgi:hypothetical protein
VSKKYSAVGCNPSLVAPSARMAASPCTLSAIAVKPFGPWYTAYRDAMLANRACSKQQKQYQNGIDRLTDPVYKLHPLNISTDFLCISQQGI